MDKTNSKTITLARSMYESLASAIDSSCNKRDNLEFNQFVAANNFVAEDTTRGMIYAQQYTRTFADKSKLVVEYRSYDPSGPFQNDPDINKFEARIVLEGKTISEFKQEYSDTF